MNRNLHNWVFTYNIYTNKWQAVKREDYPLLFNDLSSRQILKSSNINTLVEIVKRTNGNEEKLKKLVKSD